MMKKRMVLLAVILVMLIAVGNGYAGEQSEKAKAAAPKGDAPVHLRIAAAGLGSSLYVYAATMADLLRPHLPDGSTIDILPSPGGVANAKLVALNKAELALTHSVSAKWARDGIVEFNSPQENIRGVVGKMDSYVLISVVTEKTGLKSIEEIKEKKYPLRLMTVPVGGNGEAGARHILEAYGITYDMIKSWGGSVTHTSRPAIVNAIKDGHANAWFHMGPPGHPSFSELSVTTDIRFLPLKQEATNMLFSKYGYSKATLPAGSFKGQDSDVPTVGLPTVLIASKTVPDYVTYWLAKVVSENKEKLVRAYAGFKVFEPQNAWKPDQVLVELHPGAARFFKEKGWMK